MLDAVRGYLQMATGLTEITVRKALEVAESLLGGDVDTGEDSGGDGSTGTAKAADSQVQDLADDIVSHATADKEALVGLIRGEIDRAAGRLGFVREEELAAVRRHVVRLEGQVVEVRAELAAMGTPGQTRSTLAKPRSKPAPEASAAAPSGATQDATESGMTATQGAAPEGSAKPVKRKVPAGTRAAAASQADASSPQADA